MTLGKWLAIAFSQKPLILQIDPCECEVIHVLRTSFPYMCFKTTSDSAGTGALSVRCPMVNGANCVGNITLSLTENVWMCPFF